MAGVTFNLHCDSLAMQIVAMADRWRVVKRGTQIALEVPEGWANWSFQSVPPGAFRYFYAHEGD